MMRNKGMQEWIVEGKNKINQREGTRCAACKDG
jgi:hypothetical protein